MKSLFALIFINIASSLRIEWILANTRYAPLEEGGELVGIPLNEECYNLLTLVLIINIFMLIYKMNKKQPLQKKAVILYSGVYCLSSIILFATGIHTISIASHEYIINEANIFFYVPILLFSKETLAGMSTIWVVFISLYIVLCITTTFFIKDCNRGSTFTTQHESPIHYINQRQD